jgi:hypothetical protein
LITTIADQAMNQFALPLIVPSHHIVNMRMALGE